MAQRQPRFRPNYVQASDGPLSKQLDQPTSSPAPIIVIFTCHQSTPPCGQSLEIPSNRNLEGSCLLAYVSPLNIHREGRLTWPAEDESSGSDGTLAAGCQQQEANLGVRVILWGGGVRDMVDSGGAVVALARAAPGLLWAERLYGVSMEGHLPDFSVSGTGEDCRLPRPLVFPQVSFPQPRSCT